MGVAGVHTAEQIAEFLGDGETRLIAAAYRDPSRAGELFVLPDGRAVGLRAWTKQQLRCMFQDCSAPELTTVSRANGRDGFRHGAGGGKHAAESVNHRQGKAVVANWLHEVYPHSLVEVEYATDTQRSSVADVMLVHESGQRVAFEVQYAALPVAEWRRRHESYVRQGVVDVWLWGHTRVRQSRREYATGPYRLDDVQNELQQQDMRVTFLNPETGQLGIAVDRWEGRACLAYRREYSLQVHELSAARASRNGITSPLISRLLEVAHERASQLARELEELEQARLERERAEAEAAAAEEARVAARRAQLERDMDAVGRRARSGTSRGERVADPPDSRRPTGPIDPAYAAANGLCRMCGLRLDPILTKGVHVGPCEEREERMHRNPSVF